MRGHEGLRSRGPEREAVQRCKSERSSCAKVKDTPIRVAGGGLRWPVAGGGRGATVSRPWVQNGRVRRRVPTRCREASSGLRSRLIGIRVRGFRFGCGCGPEPEPGAEHLNLIPDGRDTGPENEVKATRS